MTAPGGLPTPVRVLANAQQILSEIYALAGDVGDELRSDTRVPWTAEQAKKKQELFAVVSAIKERINQAR